MSYLVVAGFHGWREWRAGYSQVGFFSGIGHVLGNVGTAIKKATVDTGHAIGTVASNPVVQGLTAAGLAATGVGAPAAAAILAAQKGGGALLRPGGNIGDAATGAATGAITGYGVGKAGGLLRTALGGAQGAGALSPTGGIADASTSTGMPPDDGGGGVLGALRGAGGFLKDHLGQVVGGAQQALGGGGSSSGIGGLSPATLAMLGLQTANAASLGKKANDFADNAWNLAKSSYDERAPLRTTALAGLSTPRPVQDLNGLSAIRARNPALRMAGLPQAGVA